MANCVDLDEVAHFEPPHQDLHCLQIPLFSSLALKESTIVLHCGTTAKLMRSNYISLLWRNSVIEKIRRRKEKENSSYLYNLQSYVFMHYHN